MVDFELGPLAYNGVPTDTHLPAPGSPAAGLVPTGPCVLTINRETVRVRKGPIAMRVPSKSSMRPRR